jgi:hypothetical protein
MIDSRPSLSLPPRSTPVPIFPIFLNAISGSKGAPLIIMTEPAAWTAGALRPDRLPSVRPFSSRPEERRMSRDRMAQAFADFDRIQQLVERAATRLLRVLDLPSWLDPEDVMQEGFRIVCEAVERWDPERARFTTYLYLHLDLFLRRAILRRLRGHAECPLWEEEEESGDGIHEVEAREELEALQHALQRLKEEMPLAFAVVVRYFGLEGHAPSAIPMIERRLGLTRGEGQGWLQKGLDRLRSLLQERDGEGRGG